ncbi:hypothetical protein Vafri_19342 [Volvox africanus]|uniref:Uncharacterized protein n=1 Tax=Volvox africanus TaxID=51714 RepID=A0A8J4BQ26_9CHLO|nr:hypothetical protein Vafri_19342 [Volvox africanus]
MSKRGAAERDFTPAQGNMRKARVDVRRVDAFQVLMAAARARGTALPQQQSALTAATAGAGLTATEDPVGPGAVQPPATSVIPSTAPSAPCTHCGTVLPISANSCSLRQCCSCLDVFCSLCSVLDYEEREDRVFCLSCLEDQAAASRGSRGTSATGAGSGCLSLGRSHPAGEPTGRWGQVDMISTSAPARSPFPCSRTPQHVGQTGSRTPGGAYFSSRSHRGFSVLLQYAGAES